ncbi:MAG TPA: hypothetical protein VK789_26180 [Bryobacteraceae bacterium]|jgi:hypothetical protein|nr:hypothetical protein [Bryobacteraceae bacterium]
MRDPAEIEAELVAISALADDETKFNEILSWCATHPGEVPVAIHMLMRGKTRQPADK